MKNIKLNQAEIERISEATGKSMYDVIKEKVRASSGTGMEVLSFPSGRPVFDVCNSRRAGGLTMKQIKLNQAEIERLSEATGKRMFDIMRDVIMGNKNETAARGNEISVLTKYKILAVCKTGAKRDIFSPSELKGIERFLGVNARPTAAQEVPR